MLGTGALFAQDLEVDQILSDYKENAVNADLNYQRKDLRLKGTIVGVSNKVNNGVGQAEVVSQKGTHWFCIFNQEQVLDIAKLRRGDQVLLGAFFERPVYVISGTLGSKDPALTFSHCSVIRFDTTTQSSHSAPTSSLDPLTSSDVYQVGGDVSAPLLLSQTRASYSAEALRKKQQGTVKLSGVIDEHGFPTSIHVVKGLGFGLDEQAAESFSQARFRPGMKNGNPVKVKVFWATNFACDGCATGIPDSDPVQIGVLTKPMPIQNPRLGIQAYATFSISKAGGAQDVTVQQYKFPHEPLEPITPDDRITAAILQTVPMWKFQPAWRNGVAVDSAPLNLFYQVWFAFGIDSVSQSPTMTPTKVLLKSELVRSRY